MRGPRERGEVRPDRAGGRRLFVLEVLSNSHFDITPEGFVSPQPVAKSPVGTTTSGRNPYFALASLLGRGGVEAAVRLGGGAEALGPSNARIAPDPEASFAWAYGPRSSSSSGST